MTQQEFSRELEIRIDDFVSINNQLPNHLLINPALLGVIDTGMIGLHVVPNDELQEGEVVLY